MMKNSFAALMCCGVLWGVAPASADTILPPSIPPGASDAAWSYISDNSFNFNQLVSITEANEQTLGGNQFNVAVAYFGTPVTIALVDNLNATTASDIITIGGGTASFTSDMEGSLAFPSLPYTALVETGGWQDLSSYFDHSAHPTLQLWVVSDVEATPLPAALPLFATGLGVIGLLARRRKRKNATALAIA